MMLIGDRLTSVAVIGVIVHRLREAYYSPGVVGRRLPCRSQYEIVGLMRQAYSCQLYDSKGMDIKFFLTPDRQSGPKGGDSRAKSLFLNTLKLSHYYSIL